MKSWLGAFWVVVVLLVGQSAAAEDKWKTGDIIGTVSAVADNGLLLINVYVRMSVAGPKDGDSYYEFEGRPYERTGDRVFVYTNGVDAAARDVVLASVRYKDTRAVDKDPRDKVRAFTITGGFRKKDPGAAITGPVTKAPAAPFKKGSFTDRVRAQTKE